MKSQKRTMACASIPVQPTVSSIATRIRTLRRERGWSLADVERISRGSLKAVVLGSYERGDRTINLNRAIEIARIFSVPLAHLLAAPEKANPTQSRLLIDLRRVRTLAESSTRSEDRSLQTLYAFLVWIANRRCDWNGEIMSLRESDRATLALMTLMSEADLLDWLKAKKLLLTEPNRP